MKGQLEQFGDFGSANLVASGPFTAVEFPEVLARAEMTITFEVTGGNVPISFVVNTAVSERYEIEPFLNAGEVQLGYERLGRLDTPPLCHPCRH